MQPLLNKMPLAIERSTGLFLRECKGKINDKTRKDGDVRAINIAAAEGNTSQDLILEEDTDSVLEDCSVPNDFDGCLTTVCFHTCGSNFLGIMHSCK